MRPFGSLPWVAHPTVLTLALALGGCGSGSDADPPGACDGTDCGGDAGTDCFGSTFEAIQSQIFDARGCTNAACHGKEDDPAGGLDLRAAVAFDNLVRVDGASGPFKLVFPGDEDRSLLYLKLAAKTAELDLQSRGISGDPMPFGETLVPVSQDELDALEAWIRGGAQADSIVKGTEDLLGCDGNIIPDPNKIAPLTAPPPLEGVQFYSGAWPLSAEAEDEVCFVTYYDFSDAIPLSATLDCPAEWGEGRKCFSYGRDELAQDAQSHHSIINVYTGAQIPEVDSPDYDPDHETVLDPNHKSWGPWTCLGGERDGETCDPNAIGGCGDRSECATPAITSVACIGYPHAPTDFAGLGFGGGGGNRIGLGGAQESAAINVPLDGVYSIIPVKGFVSWNSHAFNLTTRDTTIEQWFNVDFVKGDGLPGGRVWRQRAIFTTSRIFAMSPVAPFTKKEICRTFELPRYSRLMSLSSHMHQRGELFRIWGPPQEPCTGGGTFRPDANCNPPEAGDDDERFMYLSRIYNDPVYEYYDPPLTYDDEDVSSRTFKACAVYDNGADDATEVKRNSAAPNSGTCTTLVGQLVAGCGCPEEQRVCLGGDQEGTPCEGDDGVCGAGGLCDACPLMGGITTDDEMFIPLGSYYVQPPEG